MFAMKKLTFPFTFTVVLVMVLATVAPARPPHINPAPIDTGSSDPGDNPLRFPAPTTVDQVVHNQGNLGTTVDNWGLIGSYYVYGLPSGEWPRNSGRHYLAEINYWMGAVTPAGDTLVADTYEDFQSLPSLSSGQLQNRILLSTDTTRYYDYDLGDTTGAANGNPAYGWRVYDNSTGEWVYTQNFNPVDSTFFEGGPLSVQESHYRFGDHANGAPLLGLEMTHTVLQWNYCYNEDFLFVILEITNNSAQDYMDFAFGIYADFAIGGFDGTGEN